MPSRLQRPGRQIRNLLASEPVWAINPPAMGDLMSLVEPGANVDLEAMSASFGAAEDVSQMARVGDVAIIPITGIIRPSADFYTEYMGATSLKAVEAQLAAAIADPQVRQVVLYVNSPGGSATGNYELAQAIYNARSVKPITAFVEGMGASAAYWNASAAGKIVASPSAFVGSVGVIYVHLSWAEALKKFGVEATIVTHGARKGDAHPCRSLSGDSLAAVQKQVSDIGAQFDAAVARGRSVTVDHVRANFGQGQVFLAEEAKSRGMIDAVMTWADFLRSIQSSTAGASPAGQNSAAQVASVIAAEKPKEIHHMKVKAALFARGLIASMDATEAEVSAALAGFFAGRGQDVPKTEGEQLAGLNGAVNASAIAAVAAPLRSLAEGITPGGQAAAPAANVAAAHAREINEARAAERQRIADIRAAGARLGVSQEAIEAAVSDGGITLEAFARTQLAAAATSTHQPIQGGARVTGEGVDRFQADAISALSMQHGIAVEERHRTEGAMQMNAAPLMFFAQQFLQLRGERLNPLDRPEEIAKRAMAMDGTHRHTVPRVGGGYSASINTPASFPVMLSNLMRKLVVEAAKAAPVRYREWCGRYPGSIPDFKAMPIVSMSSVQSLDEVIDAEPFREIKLAEESLDYMQCARYGNVLKLTPVMVVNNETGTYLQKIRTLVTAGARRLNKLCLGLLSKSLLDGYSVYDDTNHGNYVDTGNGGAPSDTQWQKMLNKCYAQTVLRASGEAPSYADIPLSVALVPPQLERAAVQYFAGNLVDFPTTSANVNIYRGRVAVVTEADLQGLSTSQWYGFCSPQLAPAFLFGFVDGYDEQGMSERWYDPATGCWNYSVETRFGAAVADYRYTVKNFGA